ncbi:MAG: hypothetical protein LBP65_03475 [Puniceicoccales bacterium]|jgi:hypothetical protein|nr:hypothetical protein [Puniceicoccales bacterium]
MIGKFFLLFIAIFLPISSLPASTQQEQRHGADLAHALGFYSIAGEAYEELLDGVDPIPWERALAIAMVQGRWDKAAELESRLLHGGPEETARLLLLRHLLSILRGMPRGDLLSNIGEEDLTAADLSWFFVAISMEAERQEQLPLAQELWCRAMEAAPSDALRADLEEFRLRAVLLNLGHVSEALVERLRTKWRSCNWRLEGIPHLKKYALLLHGQRRTDEALAAIGQQLAHRSQLAAEQVHGLHLLEFFLQPPTDDAVSDRLAQIVQDGGSSPLVWSALRLLLDWATTPIRRTALENFLQNLPKEEPILRTRLQLALRTENWKLAGDLALQLLAMPLEQSVHESLQQLWLDLALEKSSHSFSDIMAQLGGAQSPSPSLRRSLLLALAGHFYRGGDVQLAAKFLDERAKIANGPGDAGAIPLRIRVALAVGRWSDVAMLFRELAPEQAAFLLDEANDLLMGSGIASAWNGWLEEVYRAIPLPLSPAARLLWGCTLLQNSIALHRTGDAAQFLREIRGLDGIGPEIFQKYGARLALLALRTAMAREDGPAIAAELAALRSRWPHSPEAKESYFLKAVDWQLNDQLDLAAEEMQNYLNCYRDEAGAGDGGRIPEALLLLASLQTAAESPKSALATLEELWQRHPDSIFACHARLRQGDLLRELNHFEAAAQVYRSLLQRQPPPPEAPFAELALVKCQLAMDPDATVLQSALVTLEKLATGARDDPNFFLEIGHVRAFVLQKSGETRRSRQLLWQLWQSHAMPTHPNLDTAGKFWLHAIGRELLTHLDPAVDDRAIGRMLRELDGQGVNDAAAAGQVF